jgi:polyisoprenoid-binding protein YceI
MKKIVLLLVLSLTGSLAFSQTTYVFDKNHARLSFSVLHFGISHVEGNFKTFDVNLQSSKEDFSDAVIELTADVNSINTENDKRDEDLKSDAWFDVAKFADLTFKSTAFKKVKGNEYLLSGNLTIKGVTKPIFLNVVYNGKTQNPYSKKYMFGFTINGKLNRKDFNVGTSTMANVVGNEIEIKSNVEFDSN